MSSKAAVISRLVASFSSLTTILRDATLLQLSTCTEHQCASLKALDVAHTLHASIRDRVDALYPAEESELLVQQLKEQLQAGYNMCMSGLASFLAETLESFQKLEHRAASSTGSQGLDEQWFLQLWNFTCKLFSGVASWSPAQNTFIVMDLSHLLPVFDSFLSWLHPLTCRSKSWACRTLHSISQPGLLQLQKGVFAYLELMVAHVGMLPHESGPLALALSALPSNLYLSKLCCVMCDISSGFTIPANKSRHPDFTQHEEEFADTVLVLTNFLGDLYLEVDWRDLSMPINQDQLFPCALQVVNLAARHISTDLEIPQSMIKKCADTLAHLSTSGNRTNPDMIWAPSDVPSNQEMLAILRIYSINHQSCLAQITTAISSISGWLYSELDHSTLCTSLLGLILHCHTHMGGFIMHQRRWLGKVRYQTAAEVGPTELKTLQKLLCYTWQKIRRLGEYI